MGTEGNFKMVLGCKSGILTFGGMPLLFYIIFLLCVLGKHIMQPSTIAAVAAVLPFPPVSVPVLVLVLVSDPFPVFFLSFSASPVNVFAFLSDKAVLSAEVVDVMFPVEVEAESVSVPTADASLSAVVPAPIGVYFPPAGSLSAPTEVVSLSAAFPVHPIEVSYLSVEAVDPIEVASLPAVVPARPIEDAYPSALFPAHLSEVSFLTAGALSVPTEDAYPFAVFPVHPSEEVFFLTSETLSVPTEVASLFAEVVFVPTAAFALPVLVFADPVF
jgi:hypothetical protein